MRFLFVHLSLIIDGVKYISKRNNHLNSNKHLLIVVEYHFQEIYLSSTISSDLHQ